MIAAPTHVQAPASARRTVVALGMALAFISYLDRACISQAAPMIARDLHFNTIQMGYIFSAFGLSYAAMEIPSGWLIDRYGTLLVLFHRRHRARLEPLVDAHRPPPVRRR